MPRHRLDQYFTPESAVEELLKRVPLIPPHHTVLEPCAGTGNIAAPLICHGCHVITNDVDPAMPTDGHADAADSVFWGFTAPDWVVTNPPFSLAPQVVPLAYNAANLGIAMLLRLSFLEPVANRETFLAEHPPQMQIVLPRISFTGDGKTDSVTCAWMVWFTNDMKSTRPIQVVPRAR